MSFTVTDPPKIGQLVRLSKATPSNFVNKKDVGRLVTVRAFDPKSHRGLDVRVDDGDPTNDDLATNGFDIAVWVPLDCIAAVGS